MLVVVMVMVAAVAVAADTAAALVVLLLLHHLAVCIRHVPLLLQYRLRKPAAQAQDLGSFVFCRCIDSVKKVKWLDMLSQHCWAQEMCLKLRLSILYGKSAGVCRIFSSSLNALT